MQVRIYTGYESQILKIGVNTSSQQQIRVIVSDADQVNTVFTNRYSIVNGNQYFYVRMPLAPKVSIIELYNDKDKQDTGFSLIGTGIWKMPLEKKMDIVDVQDKYVSSFINLGQRFAYNAGILKTGMYQSDDGSIRFSYLDTIMNGNAESATPARIGEIDAVTEISKKLFVPYTVPMRFAILCHEFAHYFANANMYSEVEADLQGLMIYLGLGYPRIEAYEAFLKVFIDTPSELNARRMKIIERFINDFENHKFLQLY